jgi:hypothetical protein
MLYVFGGSRDMATSLNDFWRLDLSTRRLNKLKTNSPFFKYLFFLVGKEY